MDCVDVVNEGAADMDIADDSVWNRIRAKLSDGTYSFLFAGPPCRTFSSALQVRPGPPPLRDKEHPYGFPRAQARQRGLRPADFEKLRVDNLTAVRTAEACTILHDKGYGYAVEQPWPKDHTVAIMFDLAPFAELQRRGATIVTFDQCRYGAPTAKPTQVLHHGAPFHLLHAQCDHPPAQQRTRDGHQFWAAHPPCVGVITGTGAFATKALAAYPGPLNRRIAAIIKDSLAAAS